MSEGRDYLDLVRKMLAYAKGVSSDAERDAFNERAEALAAKYGIDQAQLAADGKADGDVHDRWVRIEPPYVTEKAVLLSAVVLPYRGQKVQMKPRIGQKHLEYHLFGFDADLDRIEVIYNSLLTQVTLQLSTVQPEWWEAETVSTRAYRSSWLVGFATQVYKRLQRVEQEAVEEANEERPGTDLILADRKTVVEAALVKRYPRLKRERLSSNYHGAAFRKGGQAGDQADLGHTRLGTGAGPFQEPKSR